MWNSTLTPRICLVLDPIFKSLKVYISSLVVGFSFQGMLRGGGGGGGGGGDT
jgi:hypothetical protein